MAVASWRKNAKHIKAMMSAFTSKKMGGNQRYAYFHEHQEVDERFLRSGRDFDVAGTMAEPVRETRCKPNWQQEVHKD
jgi:hypothetical protein